MRRTEYLTLEEVFYLHRRLTERFGGASRVEDPGLIESALHRPRSSFYESLSEQAAALLQSLVRGRGFSDANQQVAFAACAAFLRLNGHHMVVQPDSADRFITGRVRAGEADLDEIAQWVEQAMERVTR